MHSRLHPATHAACLGGLIAGALVLLAPHACAETATTPKTWTREVTVDLVNVPEGLVSYVQVKLEVPRDYPITVKPTTSISKDAADKIFDIQTLSAPKEILTAAKEDQSIILTAMFSKPYDLPGHLLRFSIDTPEPDGLDRPISLRKFIVMLDNGVQSRTAEADVFIERKRPDPSDVGGNSK